MRTHPKIQALLDKETGRDRGYRAALEEAATAYIARNKLAPRPGPFQRREIIASMHADLIIAGAAEMHGMTADLWILRSLRELEAFKSRVKIMPSDRHFVCENLEMEDPPK